MSITTYEMIFISPLSICVYEDKSFAFF